MKLLNFQILSHSDQQELFFLGGGGGGRGGKRGGGKRGEEGGSYCQMQTSKSCEQSWRPAATINKGRTLQVVLIFRSRLPFFVRKAHLSETQIPNEIGESWQQNKRHFTRIHRLQDNQTPFWTSIVERKALLNACDSDHLHCFPLVKAREHPQFNTKNNWLQM